MKSLDSQQLSLLLAASVCLRFRGTQIAKIWGDGSRFFADVVLNGDWEEAFLPLVEKQLEELVQEDLEFQELEMTSASAAGLFGLKKQELLGLELPRDKQALVQVLRCGDWAAPYIEGAMVEIGSFFVLTGAREVGALEGKAIYRFSGVVSIAPIKRKGLVPVKDAQEALEEQELLQASDAGFSYLPKGEAMRQYLLEMWKKLLIEQKFRFVATPQGFSEEETLERMASLGYERVAQTGYVAMEPAILDYGILTPSEGFNDLFTAAVPEDQALSTLISFLQMIRRILTIFSFETQCVLRTPQASSDRALLLKALGDIPYRIEPSTGPQAKVVLQLVDAEGRRWDGPQLGIAKAKSGSRTIFGSLLGNWERFIAMLVQKERGIPLALVEEQVRIFLLRPDLQGYAEEVRNRLENADLRTRLDSEAVMLKQRIHAALKERVPYLVVIGPEEANSQTISCRTSEEGTETRMTVDEFVNMVKH